MAEFAVLKERAQLLAVKCIGDDINKSNVQGKSTEDHCIYSYNLGTLIKYLHVCKFPVILFSFWDVFSVHLTCFYKYIKACTLVWTPGAWRLACSASLGSAVLLTLFLLGCCYALQCHEKLWPTLIIHCHLAPVTEVKPMKDYISSYCVPIIQPYNAVGKNLVINCFIQPCL